MKIIFIHQGPPHNVHKIWIEQITDIFISYIPEYTVKIKFLNDFVYSHPLINQLFALINIINIPSADIYFVEGFKTILPAILNKRKGVKIVLINSDTFFANYPKQNWLIKKIYSWYIQNVDYFICTSSIMKDMASKYSSVPCYIIHPFVDTEKFKDQKCNLDSSNICAISTARYAKGGDIMIDIFKKFQLKFPDANLFICDWGEYLTEFKKIPNVIAPGFCDPIPYLSKSGLYINASRLEPFGVNILEAMNMGIPPVISEFCGAKDIVKKVNKSLICKLDSQVLANRLIELQRDKKKKIKLSKKCRKVVAEYCKENSVQHFKEAFSKIIKDIKMQQVQNGK